MLVESITSVIIPLSVVTITFAIGLELSLEDFRLVLSQTRKVVLGASSELVVPILVSFSLLALLDVPPAVVGGVIILVSCPSGIFSNALTYIGSGNLSLSITLTAFSSFMALIGLPLVSSLGFWLFLRQDESLTLPIAQTYMSLFFMVLLPMTLGMIVLAKHERWAMSYRGLLKKVSQVIIIAAAIMAIFGDKGKVAQENLSEGAVLAFLFLVGNAILGYLVPKLGGLDKDSCFAIAMEICNKNVSLVVLISIAMIEQPDYAIFAVVYWLFVKAILLPLAILRGYLIKKKQTSPRASVPQAQALSD